MSYWEERFAQLEEAQNRTAIEYQKQAEKALEQAQRKIDYEIEVWFNRMAINNNISMAEAKRLLTSKELKEFKWDVKDYIKYGEENALNEMWMKELENASARYHISRLEALKLKTQHQLEVVYGNQLDSIDDMMRKVYTDNYYHTCYEIQKGLHIGWDIGEINERKLNKVLKNPWATDGKTFSDRIWTKKNQMVGELHQQMARQIIQGKSPNVAIKEMQKYVDSSIKNAKYTASRLIMTEQAFIASASTKDSYHDLDVEMYEILATLDSRTSEICQNLDGEVFPTKEYAVGATAPPFHVNCRTTTIPHFDDNYTGERIARDEDGKTYYVPDSMKYKDWKECFVDKTKDPDDFLEQFKVEDLFSFTDAEKEAIKYYVSGEGQWINQYLRGRGDFGTLSDSEKRFLNDLTSATDRLLPDDIQVLYRSVDAEAIFGDLDWREWEDLEGSLLYNLKSSHAKAESIINKVKGKTITEKGFMSTTKDYDLASEWRDFTGAERPVVIELNVPKGIKGADLKDFDVEGDEQFEVLLARNTKYKIKDITAKDGQIYIKADLISEDVVDEIEEIIEANEHKVVEGQFLYDSWVRRSDDFQFDIEDTINAQGFDGLPRIVSADEFDELVKESNFIAQRTYSAPNQEVLDAYRDQLYNGKWYVDCSTGGAQYGQGMYCAGDYTGTLSQGIHEEMRHYISLGKQNAGFERFKEHLETLTLEDIKPKYKVTEKEFEVVKRYMTSNQIAPSAYRLSPEDREIYNNMKPKAREDVIRKLSQIKSDIQWNTPECAYIETLTLDKSAKILDIYNDDTDVHNYCALEYAKRKVSPEAKKLVEVYEALQRNIDLNMRGAFDHKVVDDLYEKRNAIAEKELYQKEVKPILSEFHNKHGRLNAGSVATLMGYDAINAVEHGKSGSYTVILNRTKVIFKKGE